MKIALAQINPTIGDLEGNVRRIREAHEQAASAGAEWVVFSELALSGYPPKDLLNKADFLLQNRRALDALVTTLKGPVAVLGHVGQNNGPTGKRLTNAASVFQNGSVLCRADKLLLPDYDVFDESRYFDAGDCVQLVDWHGLKVGITVCEDIWNYAGFYDHDHYRRHPVEELAKAGMQALINVSASPYRTGRARTRQELGRHIVKETGVPLVLVNQVGGNDDLVFDGHSFALDVQGTVIAQAKGFEEDLVTVDLKTGQGVVHAVAGTEEEELFHALVLGVRDYLHKCGYAKAVVGLSGGIDSAVVAVLAVHALGADNVQGVSMPSYYTAPESVTDAEKLAANLGMIYSLVPIRKLFDTYKNTLAPLLGEGPESVTEENIQARIRGNILMAVSNKTGSMVLSTGNKSEMAVGYCTLYGDMAGGLAVISDVPKMKVYQLARWINREREIIPSYILERPPTAELRPNQTDQDSLPPYEVLDPILEGYIERHLSPQQLVEKGYDVQLVREIIQKVDNNEYKRKQGAPGLRVTSKAFGSGRRLPIAQRYRPGN
ncbi:NAD+ synthase [Nitrospina watsonii]|uniref:Glutamine-dependent NAD(+) synthetase n=1 Tax=Nitrospina watsonii TaxID=1323948 RepID=A0ABM9HBF9_9BACT|nr:NAD+ synthase [Nitrospina watsonii]CAI2717491.1 glutamine-dependent NAD(+) synthetase [Nitrospina watsonii]